MELEKKVKEIIGKVVNTHPEHIRLDASLKDDLGATSLDRYTIFIDIEEAFSLELDQIPEDELETKFNTVSDIVEFLKEHLSKVNPSS